MTRRNNIQIKIEDGKLMIGRQAPDVRKDIGPCSYCRKPVYASSGQLIKYRNGEPTHKACRK